MREEYDFSKGKSNPYVKQAKQTVTIKLSVEAISYFKSQSEETGIPYQTLIFISPTAQEMAVSFR